MKGLDDLCNGCSFAGEEECKVYKEDSSVRSSKDVAERILNEIKTFSSAINLMQIMQNPMLQSNFPTSPEEEEKLKQKEQLVEKAYFMRCVQQIKE